jgi:hypothetical protein
MATLARTSVPQTGRIGWLERLNGAKSWVNDASATPPLVILERPANTGGVYPEIHDFLKIMDEWAHGAPIGKVIGALVGLFVIALVLHKLREL